jgi:hypothetical protein
MNQHKTVLLSDGGFSKLDDASSQGFETVENFATEKEVAHRTYIVQTDTQSLFEKRRGDNVSSLNHMSRTQS